MADFQLHENMENVKDSMQFDSGTLIAEYHDNDFSAEIEVLGEVRIIFENEVYKTPSDFPQELQKIIAEGNLYNDERVEVGENNWFEITIIDNNKNMTVDIGDDPVVNIEGMNAEQIETLCAEMVNEIRENLKELNQAKQAEFNND